MKEVVSHYVKKCTLVVANKTNLLHGKDSARRVKNEKKLSALFFLFRAAYLIQNAEICVWVNPPSAEHAFHAPRKGKWAFSEAAVDSEIEKPSFINDKNTPILSFIFDKNNHLCTG